MRVLFGLGLVLFVGGLLAAILYPIAVLSWSGEPLATVARADDADAFDGGVALDRSMSPVRASFETSYQQPMGASELWATVTLRRPDGSALVERRLRVHSPGEGGIGGATTTSMPLERFDVTADGTYRVEVRLEERLGGRFRDASVELRRNVRPIDWTLEAMLGGVALLGLALSLGVDFLRDLFGLARDARGAVRDVTGR